MGRAHDKSADVHNPIGTFKADSVASQARARNISFSHASLVPLISTALTKGLPPWYAPVGVAVHAGLIEY